MKHLKEFENNQENLIEKDLLNILDEELYTEDYYGATYISNDSKRMASMKIIKYLNDLGIDFNMYINSKKYNV